MSGRSSSEESSPRRSDPSCSPFATLTHEYSLAVQTASYNEIWSKIHRAQHHDQPEQEPEQELVLERVLQPNRESVEEALAHADSTSTLTHLVSDYFRHSEDATRLCLLLHHSVSRARELYAPLHQLVDVLDNDESMSLSKSQCSRALDMFLQFDRRQNPFPSPDSPDNFDDTRRSFLLLKDRLDLRLRTSRSNLRRLRRATVCSAICLVATAIGVIASAAVITVHALTAAAVVAASPSSSSCCCCSINRVRSREVAQMNQLDAAAKGTCVLNNDLATIDRLARRMYTAVEGDRLLVRLGLERGSADDKHPIQEVLKQLRKSYPNLLQLMNELDQHICLCFNIVNRARSLLLQHIIIYNSQSLD